MKVNETCGQGLTFTSYSEEEKSQAPGDRMQDIKSESE